MAVIALKPCPFCASRNLDIYIQMHEGNDVGCKVVCERCWSSGPLMNGATEEQARALWNARRNKAVQLQKLCVLLTALSAVSASFLMASIRGNVGFFAVLVLYFIVMSFVCLYLLKKENDHD